MPRSGDLEFFGNVEWETIYQCAEVLAEHANVHLHYAILICITGGTMGTVRKTITLTDQHERWIKVRTATGDLTSDSEYIRELIRRDQEESIKLQALKSAIQEGLDSGVSDKTVPQIMKEVEARLRVCS